MYKDYPAAYQVSKGSALQVDTAFYERIRDHKDQRILLLLLTARNIICNRIAQQQTDHRCLHRNYNGTPEDQ